MHSDSLPEGTLVVDKSFTIFYQPSLEKEAKFLKTKLRYDVGIHLPLPLIQASGKVIVVQQDKLAVEQKRSLLPHYRS